MVNSLFLVPGKVRYSGNRIGMVIMYNNAFPILPFGNVKLIGVSSSGVSFSLLVSTGYIVKI